MELSTTYPGVELGANTEVDVFVVLGKPPRGAKPGELKLCIGPDSAIRSHVVIYAGTQIGREFQCGHHVLIRDRTTIGDRCSVGSGSSVEFCVTIGNDVRLHTGVFVPEYSVLEDRCWLGPRVVVTNARYPASPRAKERLEGVRICEDAKIGANTTILPGVTIGRGALIGAGSVVTRDVEAGVVAFGNPARPTGWVRDLVQSDTGAPVYPERF